VLYTREKDHATVVIRRPERRAKAASDAVGEILGHASEGVLYLVIGGAFVAVMKPIWLLAIIPGFVAICLAIYMLSWLFNFRLAKPIIIELTPTELILANLDNRAGKQRFIREGLYAIYCVSYSGNIFIRRRGQEMVEFLATPDAAESKRIAEFLRDAAGLLAYAADQVAPGKPTAPQQRVVT